MMKFKKDFDNEKVIYYYYYYYYYYYFIGILVQPLYAKF